MARIRRFDGTKVYNEAWDSATRDVLFYLIGVVADNYGFFPAGVQSIAEKLGLDPHVVQDRLDVLLEASVFIPYEANGCSFYAVRRWQDYQQVKYPGKPACPIPSDDILGKLSPLSQEGIQRYLNTLSPNGDAKPRPAVAVAVAVVGNANAFPSPAETDLPASQWALRYFYWRLQRHTNLPKPVMPFGRAGHFLKTRESEEDAEDFRALIDEFFEHRIRGDKSSANWSLFESAYNALCIQVQKKRGVR